MVQGNLKELNDIQLLSLIKEGNRLAFNQLYHKYWKSLYAYAFNILNDKGLTQDALHEAFMAIWTKREELGIGSLKNYLFNAVRNHAITTLRKDRFTELHNSIIENLKSSSEAEQNFDLNDLKLASIQLKFLFHPTQIPAALLILRIMPLISANGCR